MNNSGMKNIVTILLYLQSLVHNGQIYTFKQYTHYCTITSKWRGEPKLIDKPWKAIRLVTTSPSNIIKKILISMGTSTKHGVALTECNTTGPPRAALWWATLHMRVLQTTTDASNRY